MDYIFSNLKKAYKSALFFTLVPTTFFGQTGNLNLINTNPPGAEILDNQDKKIGTTPFDFKNLDPKTTKIKIVRENYNTIEITLKEKKKENDTFFNSVTECKTCLLDNESNTLKLIKSFKENENSILVGVEDPVLEIDKEQILGKLNGYKVRLKDDDVYFTLGYPENMEMQILNSFKDSYINAQYFSRKSLEKDESNIQNPKIIFKPVVKKLNFDLNGKLLREYKGKCFLECEWQIFDISDLSKPIQAFTIQTSYLRSGNNYELLLHEMISLSERSLLENDSLFDLISDTEKKHLENSKGKPIEIPLVLNRSYSNSSEMLKEVINSIVTVETETQFGSGAFISNNGHIITNYHVIAGNKPIFVKIDKDKKLKAEIVKYNKDYDLAILKVDSTVKGLTFSDSDKTSLGDDVFAIGTPLNTKLGQSITKGIISGYRKLNGVDFIQSDVSINSGNSGGPMVNSKGEIIGINTLKATGKNVSGIGFSIPSNIVLKMLNVENNN